jgi:hypothetical protein
MHAIGGEDFQRADQRRFSQRMGVDADEERAVDAGTLAVIADRLADARMWFSLKELWSAEPRWPEVPKATRWAGMDGSGLPAK